MILEAPSGAPPVVPLAVAAILYSHMGGSIVGMASGGVAMMARKGERVHRWAGHVFFVAMLAMAGIGAAVAPFLSDGQGPNTLAGFFTVYLVLTGWVTVRRPPGALGRFEIAAAVAALGIAMMSVALALGWISTPSDANGPPDQIFLVFAVIAALAAACDLRVIRRGGLSGVPRITRHLWRMALALIIAAGSFAAQPRAIPDFLKGTMIPNLPMLAAFIGLIYWLIRIRFPGALKPRARGDHQRRPTVAINRATTAIAQHASVLADR